MVAAPHRLFFLLGSVQLLLSMLLWATELLARYFDYRLAPPLTVPAAWGHVFLMLYGVFPCFVFGFLLTVFPRWLNGPVVPRGAYVSAFVFLAMGVTLFYSGLFLHKTVLALALVLILCGWAVVMRALLGVYWAADRRGSHETLLCLALAAGVLGIVCYLFGIWTRTNAVVTAASNFGLWLFLLPVVFSVSHRMIPFFTHSALPNYRMARPAWGLPVVAAGVVGHAILEMLGHEAWLFLFDLPLALAALYHTAAWNIQRSFEVRLVAMLHIAFLWLAIAMLMYTVQSLTLLVTGEAVLGRAPLHALGIGFLTGMIVSMVSRVTLGHSGRQLTADHLTWYVLLGVNITAVLRIAAELISTATPTLNVLAAVAWLACLIPWVWRYAPMYLRPRVDGRPG
jgi:uncharacterized protein involved in response to NO